MNRRQWNFYNVLKMFYNTHGEDYWVSKEQLAGTINRRACATYYELNYSEKSHDICSLMNQDMAEINESPLIDKFILLKNNHFKIATKKEAEQEIENLKKRAMRLLVRMSRLSHKVRNNGQGKLLSNQLNEIDETSRAREYVETFIERREDDTKNSEN